MNILSTPFKEVLLLEPQVFSDERGHFLESFQDKRYQALGLPPFVQDNVSYSHLNVLRGLHYQKPHAQGKLVSVLQGRVFDVIVDIRQTSASYKQWFGIELSASNRRQLYIPPGFAHGFCVLQESGNQTALTIFHYKCTDYYAAHAECGIRYDDPSLNITWPIPNPIVAAKDLNHPFLSELPDHVLFA